MAESVGHVQFKNFTLKKTLQLLFMDGVQLLIFNTRSLGLPVAHLVDLRGKNGWDDLGATQLFSTQDLWIGNPAPWPLGYCSFRPTHLLFKYEQKLFNFSNIQLEQQINFLQNPFFIHLAIWNVIPLFAQLSNAKAN